MSQPGLNFANTDFTKIDFTTIQANHFFYGADINNGLLYSKMDNTGTVTPIEDGGSSGNILTIIPITYAALRTAMTGATLVAGQMYVITDFQTIYDQPDFDAAGIPKVVVVTKTAVVEPLVIQALSTSVISSRAYSRLFPFDTIEYNVLFDTTEYMAAPAKGRISMRIDNDDNRADYDFRKVLFLRYETAPASGIFNIVNDNGGATAERLTFSGDYKSNFIGDYAIFAIFGNPFLLSNNVLAESICCKVGNVSINNTLGNGGNFITIGDSCSYITLGNSGVSTCTFSEGCNNITVIQGDYLTFGINCTDINIDTGASYLNFGNACQFITILTGAENLIFGIGCHDLSLNNNCADNIFGNRCNGSIGNGAEGNYFGNDCIIAVDDSFVSNTIGNNGNITANNDCTNNVFGINANVSMFNDNSSNHFGDNNTVNIIGDTNTMNTFLNNNNVTLGSGNSNTICGNSNTIVLQDDNSSITMGNNNNLNTGNNNTRNTLGNANTIVLNNAAQNNTFGNSCTIELPTNSAYNTFENNCADAGTFSAAVTNNNFGSRSITATNFAAATFVYAPYNCNLFVNAALANKLSYVSAIDVLTIVNANA